MVNINVIVNFRRRRRRRRQRWRLEQPGWPGERRLMADSKQKTSRIKVPKPVVRLYAPDIKLPKIQAPKLGRPSGNGSLRA